MADATGKFGRWLGRLAELGHKRVTFVCDLTATDEDSERWRVTCGDVTTTSSVGERALEMLVDEHEVRQ